MRSGLAAEFDSPEALLRAYEALSRAGYTQLSTFTPYPVKGLVTKLPESLIPWIMLAAGAFGAVFGYLLQWWCNGKSYPINVGGRPLNSVPAFIPISFESAVLASTLAGFLSMLWFSGLPRLSHPMFSVNGFERASVDRFWMAIDSRDPRFEDWLDRRLTDLGALRCERVSEGR